ncbi:MULTISPECIES: NUDIX domain-containing protein [unclassified Ensifer]|uniref:NUDIX hydrolase n=1 Tax=unclassified Ensifer TaxID=2633371 RepID=UPI000813AAB4|nr:MULTISPECIES: NUDIX domain-containing protein [unclassified Ensifer]OCO98161.1 ADP-ribose pyrophosphatase [Ensifer sp. LC14]OCP03803.1 ADP-ribose pyrophosphatase [Ensifer sp. LC11]OCP04224.1 ADP-ribose pyrophosphatase [Ensifer sp. LC13]OCP30333.1 ADP-ribose pyrophosphatase [Ensifer sp. LC499]
MPTKPELASSVILEREGRYLLVRRANPPSADMYAFPGGRAEPGETPAETALRELFEETGLKARNPTLFETYDLPGKESEGRHFLLSVFKAEADAEAVAVASDDAAGLGWFTPAEIFALPIPDSVRECVERLSEIDMESAKAGGGLEIAANSGLVKP